MGVKIYTARPVIQGQDYELITELYRVLGKVTELKKESVTFLSDAEMKKIISSAYDGVPILQTRIEPIPGLIEVKDRKYNTSTFVVVLYS